MAFLSYAVPEIKRDSKYFQGTREESLACSPVGGQRKREKNLSIFIRIKKRDRTQTLEKFIGS